MELWNKKYPDFIGYNCRITAFDLMKDKKLLFVEKLSFSLPYQVLKFDNRKQLKNYLMGIEVINNFLRIRTQILKISFFFKHRVFIFLC